jgi:hypothetical protein
MQEGICFRRTAVNDALLESLRVVAVHLVQGRTREVKLGAAHGRMYHNFDGGHECVPPECGSLRGADGEK